MEQQGTSQNQQLTSSFVYQVAKNEVLIFFQTKELSVKFLEN